METLEFKAKANHPDKIVKEMVAFANTKGGQLLVGVNDHGEIMGLSAAEEELYSLENAINKYCFPKINYQYEIIPISAKKSILIYTIFESELKPHYALIEQPENQRKGYIRVADRSVQASKEMKEILRRERKKVAVRFTYREKEKVLMKYLEEFYGTSLDELVQRNIYGSLGANYTTFNPLSKFDKDDIPPTEYDDYFRMQKVHGYVHDQGAAMLGGVCGHAGLFSNANDVAKIMQMYLWKGYYGGKRYFKPEVLDAFNTCYYCENDVRRGVGFDKPQLGDQGPTCGCVSMTSFGHSGFTGTFTWADPEEEVVYVFLSNRTYPTAENRMIISSNLRSNIQAVIYDAIIREERVEVAKVVIEE